jgi:hypothetical protein
MIDYLFEIVGEDSECCGERFFVECAKDENPWDIVAEYFDDEEVVPIGEYTPEEAEILGYDTY